MTKFFFFPCGSLSPENTPEQRWLQVLSSPEAPCDASTCASWSCLSSSALDGTLSRTVRRTPSPPSLPHQDAAANTHTHRERGGETVSSSLSSFVQLYSHLLCTSGKFNFQKLLKQNYWNIFNICWNFFHLSAASKCRILPFWGHPSSAGLVFSFVSTAFSGWCGTSSLLVPRTWGGGLEGWWFHTPSLDTYSMQNGTDVRFGFYCRCVLVYSQTPWSSTARLRSSLHSTSSHVQPGGHSTSSLGTAFSPFWQTSIFWRRVKLYTQV